MVEFIDALPAPSPQVVAAVEALFKNRLPDEYKLFLHQHNGAHPVSMAVVPMPQSMKGPDEVLCIDDFFALTDVEHELAHDVRTMKATVEQLSCPQGLIAIADADSVGFIVLSLRPRDYGCVHLCVQPMADARQEDEPRVELLARSFGEFLQSLRYFERESNSADPFLNAIDRNDCGEVERLLGADAGRATSSAQDGRPAVMLASYSPRMLDLLLRAGGDPDAEDPDGMTALFVPYCGVDSTRLLLEHGADPNHIDQSGSTPLMHAVEWMMRRKAGLLIDAGADVSARSGDGRYVIDFVRANSWGCDHLWPMYDTLLAGGADVGRFVNWLLGGLRDHALCRQASIILRKLGRDFVSRHVDVPSELQRLKEFVGTAETLPYGCVLKEAAEQSLAVLESSS